MPRHLLPGLLVFVLFVSAATPMAVADPQTESDRPYVGWAMFAADGSVSHTCSGVLLSSRVFLTSGGCTVDMDVALVWTGMVGEFDVSQAAAGQPVTHPAFDGFAGYPDSSDLGVVLLEEPVDVSAYAQLPAAGAFDGAVDGPAGTFSSVSIAVEVVVPFMQDEYMRYAAQTHILELGRPSTDGFNLNLVPTVARDQHEGMCVGPRGRPAFVGSSSMLAGVASVVSTSGCSGAAFYFRVDTPFAQEFIRSFLQ